MGKDKDPTQLTDGERRFVLEVIKDDPNWIMWVKKSNSSGALQSRLVVVGKYCVYSIKRTITGKKQVKRQGHFFDLKEIYSDGLDKVKLIFKDFKIVANSPMIGVDLPKVLLKIFQQFTYGFAETSWPRLVLEPQGRTYPTIEPVSPGIAGGFVETYLAQCNYYGIPSNSDVIMHVEDAAAVGNRELNLDNCPGIDKDGEYFINLTPVLAALRHNTYFASFCLHDKSRKDAISGIAEMISYNTTLTSLDVSGLEAEEGWSTFGEALKINSRSKLLVFNLSKNSIGEKSIATLTNAFEKMAHPMYSLQLANTDIQQRGSQLLFRSLKSNLAMSQALTELDISGCILHALGSTALCDWLTQLNEINPGTQRKFLRKLNLSSTQMEAAPVLDAIRTAHADSIEVLNISNNKIEDYAMQVLTSYLSKATALCELSIAGCSLNGNYICNILAAISRNQRIRVKLDISLNDMSLETSTLTWASCLAESNNVHTLELREANLKPYSIPALIKAIGDTATLRSVDLSGNFKYQPKQTDAFMQDLAAVVMNHPSLISLTIEGRGTNWLGRSLSHFWKALEPGASKLLELNVKGNCFGTDVARELFEVLRWNSTLTSLDVDGNQIGLFGFYAIKRCLESNVSLVNFKFPKSDSQRLISSVKDKVGTQDKLRELWVDISRGLDLNKIQSPLRMPRTKPPTTPYNHYTVTTESARAVVPTDPRAVSSSVPSATQYYATNADQGFDEMEPREEEALYSPRRDVQSTVYNAPQHASMYAPAVLSPRLAPPPPGAPLGVPFTPQPGAPPPLGVPFTPQPGAPLPPAAPTGPLAPPVYPAPLPPDIQYQSTALRPPSTSLAPPPPAQG